MQLGGIGDNHNADMHQVTACLHDHGKSMQGGLKMQTNPSAAARQALQENQEQQAQLSLADILQKLLRSGRQRLIGFWNGSDGAGDGDKSAKSDKSQVMAQSYDTNVTKGSDAAARETLFQSNPYFAAVAEPPKPTVVPLFQKVKLKCKNVAGQLAQHLPGRFFNFQKKGTFQTKKEGSREDMRKRSKYRQDKVEIDCVLTDESYLLDSYDRKGEYSQLTTKK